MIRFWAKTTLDGKPGISVEDHMLCVGWVARCIAEITPGLLERFCLLANEVGVLAALHDLGKISPGFQRRCPAWLADNDLEKIACNGCWDTTMEADHGKVSHAAIQTFLVEAGFDRRSAKYVAAILGAHHGRLNPPNDRGYRPPKLTTDSVSKIDWHTERMAAARRVWDKLGGARLDYTLVDTTPVLWWIAGLTSVADWIGSDERFFPPAGKIEDEKVPALAQVALQEIGIIPPVLREGRTFTEIFGFPSNEMQTKTLATITEAGVYVIEAPMGMGKTEAALGAAYRLLTTGKATGIYFALPTQATSNRIHLRMNEFLRRISPDAGASRLIHGNSWLMRENLELQSVVGLSKQISGEDAGRGRDWFASAKRALLAPFGVGTVDQALLGVVAAKHFFVRHFALAGKVVILDEVHSYDLYTGTLIDKLISTLEDLGCTVIVLSATLTGDRRAQIAGGFSELQDNTSLSYPLISGRRESVDFAPVAAQPPVSKFVQVDFISENKAAEEAIRLASDGGTVLWICNTVDAAQRQFRRLVDLPSGSVLVGLLHSRFPFQRREELETEWMDRFGKDSKNRCGSILVATQVVEQSVDLDADFLITELAPTDMLLQRLGRLWRHERGKRPVDKARMCVISETKSFVEFQSLSPQEIKKELGSKAFVYDPYILLRTLDVWHHRQNVEIPCQIRTLIESTYAVREDEPESWQELFYECEGKAMAYRQQAAMNSNIWNIALPDEEGVQTRLNEMPTVTVVLCRSFFKDEVLLLDRSKIHLNSEQYRLTTAQAIHKNLVKVPRYCFERVESCQAFSEYLHGEYSVGLVKENGGIEIVGLQKEVRLYYTNELGLVIEKDILREEV